MRASLDWLKDLIDIDIPADEAAHKLTMAGLEVEGLEEVDEDFLMNVGVSGKDYVFEVNVTQQARLLKPTWYSQRALRPYGKACHTSRL